MAIKRKVIAREFLIFSSTIVLGGFIFLGTYFYDYYLESKINSLNESININIKKSKSENC